MIPQVSSLITVGFGYHLTGFRSSFFARFSTMPAATPPRPPKAIQDIIDGVADHGVDYDTDKVAALPQPDDFTVACGITLFGGPQAKALEVILVRLSPAKETTGKLTPSSLN